jgi:hypothetical protein
LIVFAFSRALSAGSHEGPGLKKPILIPDTFSRLEVEGSHPNNRTPSFSATASSRAGLPEATWLQPLARVFALANRAAG